MDRSTLSRIGAAGTVAGLGLAIGGVSLASADDTATPSDGASSSAHPGGPRGGHGDLGQDAEVLASELGLEESVVEEALSAVRDELRPAKTDADDTDTKPTPPTEAERSERQAALVAALAKELDVSETKVQAAVAALEERKDAERTERKAESRADLVTRLDAAVDAGTLTAADRASVLKAYDADLLGVGGPGGGRPGPDSSDS